MERLPDELLLHIFSFLDHQDLVRCQQLSQRFKLLARDSNLWKERCFDLSPAEAIRRRQKLFDDANDRLAALRNAMSSLSGELATWKSPSTGTSSNHERHRALANWDPSYLEEQLDFYQEYIHRNAPIAPIEWFPLPKHEDKHDDLTFEATGMSTLADPDGNVQHMVTPLDDGSVCVWNFSHNHPSTSVHLSARSPPGLLTGLSYLSDRAKIASDSATIMTDTNATDSVTLDPLRQRGYFAVQHKLHEIDLTTLRSISTTPYPFPITALSPYSPTQPLSLGTTSTLHLHDPRSPTSRPHAVLSQPTPLSLLPLDDSLWVSGRFTHLLQYSYRFFPRLLSTLHSGARISSLTSLPPSSSSATALLAAGVYKGKGSLELHPLPSASSTSHTAAVGKHLNRQTASSSALLCARPHGGAIVATDADGGVTWLERNARYRIRSVNINSPAVGGKTVEGEGEAEGDFVRRLVPMYGEGQVQNPLLLWSSDGRVGVMGWGAEVPVKWEGLEDEARRAERRARREEEVVYGSEMRRALEGQANEVRFMRAFGMG
ncbi:hypothetical protein K461DRAFT_229555 [Myriangium duriaei CBS 260.36]|uniref:F-box domain-containing protein n=1 Tax=Myriangium duriaei CBS 260.36 TaxID=1168546 RepID=A0A9P4MFA0_9PEZI|nr:hypothetical protein K461DRAFT_229555 [Myriangium duriaei CBS 260.36]